MLYLSYELMDNPGHEYEHEVENEQAAKQYLQSYQGLVVWANLTNAFGDTLAETSDLI